MNPRLFLVPFVAFTVVALVACGGGKKNDSASSNNSSSSSSSSQSSSKPTGTGTLDLSKTGDQLSKLKSFHFDLAMKLDAGSAATPSSGASGSSGSDADLAALILGFLTDVKATGAFVAPNSVDLTMKIAGQDIGFITIGDKSWVKFGNTWQAGDPSSGLSSSDSTSSPSDLLSDNLSGEVLKGAKTSEETVNGVKATHYAFDKAALEQAVKDSGDDTSDFKTLDKANLDVWMNSDNIPVKLSVSMNGKDDTGKKIAMDLQMNLKDINSNITIKPPI